MGTNNKQKKKNKKPQEAIQKDRGDHRYKHRVQTMLDDNK